LCRELASTVPQFSEAKLNYRAGVKNKGLIVLIHSVGVSIVAIFNGGLSVLMVNGVKAPIYYRFKAFFKVVFALADIPTIEHHNLVRKQP
jgi:hypothetical protein